MPEHRPRPNRPPRLPDDLKAVALEDRLWWCVAVHRTRLPDAVVIGHLERIYAEDPLAFQTNCVYAEARNMHNRAQTLQALTGIAEKGPPSDWPYTGTPAELEQQVADSGPDIALRLIHYEFAAHRQQIERAAQTRSRWAAKADYN